MPFCVFSRNRYVSMDKKWKSVDNAKIARKALKEVRVHCGTYVFLSALNSDEERGKKCMGKFDLKTICLMTQ